MNHNPSPAAPSHVPMLGAVLIIIILTLYVFGSVTHFDFVNLDDDVYVARNAHVLAGLSLDNLRWSFSADTHTYWHPLVWLSLMLDTTVYGTGPAGYHTTNLLLHLANALLLFWILLRGTGSVGKSLTVALLFSVHPLNAESVAWIVERKNVLSSFFLLLSMGCYLRFARERKILPYLLALGCHACGLMTKPSVMILPGLLLLLDLWPLGRWPLRDAPATRLTAGIRLVIEKIPFMLLSLASYWLLRHALAGQASVELATSVPMVLRLENAMLSYVVYLGQLAWPFGLACYYPFPTSISAWQWLGATALLVVMTCLIVGHPRTRPFLVMGWCWYGIALFPSSGLQQTGLWPATADRFMYVPMIGLWVILAWGLPLLLPRLTAGHLRLLSVVALIYLTSIARQQVGYWKNGTALFSRAVAIAPNHAFTHTNLGNALLRDGRLQAAVDQYQTAIHLAPGYSMAHNDLGVALHMQGKLSEATAAFSEAVRLSPNYVDALINRGLARYQSGHSSEAIDDFKRVLAIDPTMTDAKRDLDYARVNQGISGLPTPATP